MERLRAARICPHARRARHWKCLPHRCGCRGTSYTVRRVRSGTSAGRSTSRSTGDSLRQGALAFLSFLAIVSVSSACAQSAADSDSRRRADRVPARGALPRAVRCQSARRPLASRSASAVLLVPMSFASTTICRACSAEPPAMRLETAGRVTGPFCGTRRVFDRRAGGEFTVGDSIEAAAHLRRALSSTTCRSTSATASTSAASRNPLRAL